MAHIKTEKNTTKEDCRQCQLPFLAFNYRLDRSKYCSESCRSKSINQELNLSANLKPISYWTGKKRLDMSGDKNWKWKGGVSKGYKKGYYSTEYKNWRKAVFKRDDFACVDCGYRGYITAHHIKSFAYFPESRYDINNGKTLCEECHKKTDNYKGRAKKDSHLLKVLINK